MMGVSGLMFPDASDLPVGLHYFAGIADILGALGLILPGLFKIQTRLTPLAAAGLVLLMIGATVWHSPSLWMESRRDEIGMIVFCLVLAAFCGFVAYGRWRLSPLKDRSNTTSP